MLFQTWSVQQVVLFRQVHLAIRSPAEKDSEVKQLLTDVIFLPVRASYASLEQS